MYASAAQAASTKRSYARDMTHFRKNGGKVPCSPDTVAEYLAKFAGILAVATLEHRLVAIHRAHTDKGMPSPVSDRRVKQTMQGIRRTFGVSQRQAKALVRDDLLELLTIISQQKPLKSARDKSLILIGFAGGFRRSELVSLRVEDITPHAHGIELLIRRSKTDQEGRGRMVFIPLARSEERCPVKSLEQWLDLSGIGEGPIFRAVNRHDQVLKGAALTPQSVALVLKRAVRLAKGESAASHVSGHSLRSGFVSSAVAVGMQINAIMLVTGHRSLVTVQRYVQDFEKRRTPSLL